MARREQSHSGMGSQVPSASDLEKTATELEKIATELEKTLYFIPHGLSLDVTSKSQKNFEFKSTYRSRGQASIILSIQMVGRKLLCMGQWDGKHSNSKVGMTVDYYSSVPLLRMHVNAVRRKAIHGIKRKAPHRNAKYTKADFKRKLNEFASLAPLQLCEKDVNGIARWT
ncbi:hypothetical protein SELMODRAFT_413008 [Selaginella moellendorffii]|uniref:Uncharacterized protein n=1 Tax=Selaginella moellendorffii TaxID=88036 RepID=D8RN19_SELML|nr:hypothetical protein SELMODRAFT_413008 [Selaginella moellendorffii]